MQFIGTRLRVNERTEVPQLSIVWWWCSYFLLNTKRKQNKEKYQHFDFGTLHFRVVQIVSETGMKTVGRERSSDDTEAEGGGSLTDVMLNPSLHFIVWLLFSSCSQITKITKILRTLTSTLTFCLTKTGDLNICVCSVQCPSCLAHQLTLFCISMTMQGDSVCHNNQSSKHQIQSELYHCGWLELIRCDTISLCSLPLHLLILSLFAVLHWREILLESSMFADIDVHTSDFPGLFLISNVFFLSCLDWTVFLKVIK